MSTYEAISLMIAFAMLIVAILGTKKITTHRQTSGYFYK